MEKANNPMFEPAEVAIDETTAVVGNSADIVNDVAEAEIIEFENMGGHECDSAVATPAENHSEDNRCAEKPNEMQKSLSKILETVELARDSSSKIADEIHGLHRLYHTEVANRISSMQSELERYREIEKGRIFDDILSELAKIYSENETLIDEVSDEKIKKKVRYMFLDILQLLESNGVSKQKSNVDDKRNVKHCRIIEQIPTDNPELHDTIVESNNTGFSKENRTYIHERVKIRVFSKKTEILENKTEEVCENE